LRPETQLIQVDDQVQHYYAYGHKWQIIGSIIVA